MEQHSIVTTDQKGPTEPLEGGRAGPVGHASPESKPRKRVSLRQASLEAAVRLLCSLHHREPTEADDARIASYAKDGF